MEPTLTKVLIAAVVIFLVWRWFGRINATKQANNRNAGRSQGAETGSARRQAGNERAIEDMVKCPHCGAYVPAKGGHDCTGKAQRG